MEGQLSVVSCPLCTVSSSFGGVIPDEIGPTCAADVAETRTGRSGFDRIRREFICEEKHFMVSEVRDLVGRRNLDNVTSCAKLALDGMGAGALNVHSNFGRGTQNDGQSRILRAIHLHQCTDARRFPPQSQKVSRPRQPFRIAFAFACLVETSRSGKESGCRSRKMPRETTDL